MRHKKYERLLVLSTYDEITTDEELNLKRHLASCSRCGEFMKRLSEMSAASKPEKAELTNQFVDEARDQLHRAFAVERKKKTRRHASVILPGPGNWRVAGVPAYAAASVALVVFIAGIASDFLFLRANYKADNGMRSLLSEVSGRNSGNVAIADVRFLSAESKSGDVRFSFDIIRRYEMDGSLDDKDVQKILAFALVNSDNPGVRLRTIGMLDESVRPDREIEDALIKAVKTDGNTGVRREALLSLSKLPFDSKIKEMLLFVLQNDKNPGMRIAAINTLADKEFNVRSGSPTGKQVDPGVLDVLRERSAYDQNRYVRTKAANMLKELKES